VLTVWPWTVEILQQWTQEIRPLMAEAGSPALERGERLTVSAINRRLTGYRRALGFGPGLDFHSLRRSYVTHLTEDGWDPLFVQVLLSPLEGVHDVQHRPELLQRTGVGPDSAATLLVTIGDNPDRMASEASFAALCGASPIEASSGKTQRRRLNRGGDRQANAALYRIVLTRLRWDPHTRAYLDRRMKEGRTRREAIRCLKRYVARELYPLLRAATTATNPAATPA
jgi:Transposase IS116/IS110/IS902 family/Phage integrase family